MNYLHHYHAGNFADVMKHVLLLDLLSKLNQKDKPYVYVDTHAGEGLYNLADAPAQKSGEYLLGIHTLMQLPQAVVSQAPEAIVEYRKHIANLREKTTNGWYAGSPYLALQAMRSNDRAVLFELNERVLPQLKHNIRDKRAGIHQRDAYEGLLGVIPPQEKRGLVMIDPPYELERKDFPQLVELITNAYKKWPTGVFAVWYPIKDRAQIERFEKKLFKSGIKRQLICELCVLPDDVPTGLSGSGLLVINPPWQFSESADAALQWLLPHLRQQGYAGKAVVKWLAGE